MQLNLDYIQEIKNGDMTHWNEISGQYQNVAWKAAAKFSLSTSGKCTPQDLINPSSVLYDAIKAYPIDSNLSLSTFIWNQSKYHSIRTLNNLGMSEPNDYLFDNDPETTIEDLFDKNCAANLEDIKDFLGAQDEQTQNIVTRRFFSGSRKPVSYKEIGAEMGLSYERIRQVSQNFIDYAREKLGKKELVTI